MYGNEIDNRIKKLKLSNKEISEFCKVSENEIIQIRNDNRDTIKTQTFLLLMEILRLNPYDFGGFTKLKFNNSDDFININEFLQKVKKEIKDNEHITATAISKYAGISDVQLYRILNGITNVITIDTFAKICEYFNLNYQDYLINKQIVPSFHNNNKSKIEKLYEIIPNLDKKDMKSLIEYAKLLQTDNKVNKKEARTLIKKLNKKG